MRDIQHSTVVPYTAEQMYDLVNDIESYPEFLPWCSQAHVWDHSDTGLKASVTIATRQIEHTFATKNIMEPGRRIEVHLLRGPFKHLYGHWHFEPIEGNGCRVSMEMEFEFKNRILKLALNKLFQHVIDSLVDAFTRRAEQVYGRA